MELGTRGVDLSGATSSKSTNGIDFGLRGSQLQWGFWGWEISGQHASWLLGHVLLQVPITNQAYKDQFSRSSSPSQGSLHHAKGVGSRSSKTFNNFFTADYYTFKECQTRKQAFLRRVIMSQPLEDASNASSNPRSTKPIILAAAPMSAPVSGSRVTTSPGSTPQSYYKPVEITSNLCHSR